MNLIVTGCAGFIGFHLCSKLIQDKRYNVLGIDNLNKYYDVKLKNNRINILKKKSNKFTFKKLDISNFQILEKFLRKKKIDCIINLAAQAGVRYSIINPSSYLQSNIIGFYNILEISKRKKIKHLLFASTSSVYGYSKKFPLLEKNNTDKPLSFYAATKKSNEVMAYSYSNIYKLPATGIRFFTVYGPYGRPDMALFKFTKAIINSKKIQLYNKGNHIRDFTYIDDVVNGITKIIKNPPKNKIPFKIYNIASNKPHHLKQFLKIIEKNLNKKAKIKYFSLQKGDVDKTHGSIKLLNKLGYIPKTSIEEGVKKFIKWYKSYYK